MCVCVCVNVCTRCTTHTLPTLWDKDAIGVQILGPVAFCSSAVVTGLIKNVLIPAVPLNQYLYLLTKQVTI